VGMCAETFHPFELVGELLSAHRVAVRKVQRTDNHILYLRLDVAAVGIVWIAGKPDAPKLGRVALCQDSDAVEPLLTVPDGAIARGLDVGDRQSLVGAFELLETDDVRLLALQPF